MSRPIKITEDVKASILKSIVNDLEEDVKKKIDSNLFEGRFSWEKKWRWDMADKTCILEYTPEAYLKMISLINSYDVEVSWHSIVERDKSDIYKFIISDILVYPQTVTSATVTTDQIEYQEWLFSDENNEHFEKIRMQSHSHVNMSVSPSSVDLDYQKGIVNQLKDDDYYIFQIWNKRGEVWSAIYDMQNNSYYESDEIITTVKGINLDRFIENAKKKVDCSYKRYMEGNYGRFNTSMRHTKRD